MNLLRLTMALALALSVACGGTPSSDAGTGGGEGTDAGGTGGGSAGGTGGGSAGGTGGGIAGGGAGGGSAGGTGGGASGGGAGGGAANSAPVLGALAQRTLDEGTTATVTLTATDAEGDALTFSLQNPPGFASLAGAVVTLAPGYTNAGTYQLAVRVSDGTSNTDGVLTVIVTNVNRPPVLQPLADVSLVAGASGTVLL